MAHKDEIAKSIRTDMNLECNIGDIFTMVPNIEQWQKKHKVSSQVYLISRKCTRSTLLRIWLVKYQKKSYAIENKVCPKSLNLEVHTTHFLREFQFIRQMTAYTIFIGLGHISPVIFYCWLMFFFNFCQGQFWNFLVWVLNMAASMGCCPPDTAVVWDSWVFSFGIMHTLLWAVLPSL